MVYKNQEIFEKAKVSLCFHYLWWPFIVTRLRVRSLNDCQEAEANLVSVLQIWEKAFQVEINSNKF